MDFLTLQKKIRNLLTEKNAILLAHYYQRDEIQEIADILGDSLALSMEAAKTNAEIIVFAGVHFMAESASIISPEKTVLLPRLDAGCPLANMINANQVIEAKRENPGASVVAYVNSSAEVKAYSDICCTSSNAIAAVNSLDDAVNILMIPDGNLARYTTKFTDKRIIPWEGYCPVHHFLSVEEVVRIKNRFPKAPFAAHPECRAEVLELADFIGSTAKIIKFATECNAAEIILGTEIGIMWQLRKLNPAKTYIPASDNLICRTMKTITLEDILSSLTEMKHIIKVSDEIRIPAKKALDRMLNIQ